MLDMTDDGDRFLRYCTGTELQALSGSNIVRNRLAIAGKNLIQILRIDYDATGSCVVPEVDLLAGTNLARDVANLGSIADIRFGYNEFANKLASVSTSGKIYIFDINRKSSPNILRFSAHKRAINSIAFSPHDAGNLLLSGSQDGVIKIWDLRTKNSNLILANERKPIADFVKNFDAIRCNEFSPHDPRVFCSASDSGDISKWDMRVTNRYVNNIKNAHLSGALTLEWNNRFNYIVTGGKDNKVLVWNMQKDNTKKPDYVISVNDSIAKVSWLPATDNITKIEDCPVACSYLTSNSSVDLWDLKRNYIPSYSLQNHSKVATGLHWHAENTIWTVSKDRSFIEHDLTHETPFTHLLRKNIVLFNPSEYSEFVTVYQDDNSYYKYSNLNGKRNSFDHDLTRARTLDETTGLKTDELGKKPIVISETSTPLSETQRFSPTNFTKGKPLSYSPEQNFTKGKPLSYSPEHTSDPKSIPIPIQDERQSDFVSSSLEKISPSFLSNMLNAEISPAKAGSQEFRKPSYGDESAYALNEDIVGGHAKEFKPKLIRSRTALSVNKKLLRNNSTDHSAAFANAIQRSGSDLNFNEGFTRSPLFGNKSMTPLSRNTPNQTSSCSRNVSSSRNTPNSGNLFNKRNSSPINGFHHVPSYVSMASTSRLASTAYSPANHMSTAETIDYEKDSIPLLYVSNLKTKFDKEYSKDGFVKDAVFKIFITAFFDFLNKFHEKKINYNELLFKDYKAKSEMVFKKAQKNEPEKKENVEKEGTADTKETVNESDSPKDESKNFVPLPENLNLNINTFTENQETKEANDTVTGIEGEPETKSSFKSNIKSLSRQYFVMMANNEFVPFITKSVKEALEKGNLTNLLRIISVVFYVRRRRRDLINLLIQLKYIVSLAATFKIVKYYKIFKILLHGLIIDIESFLTDIDYKVYFRARKTRNMYPLQNFPEFYYSYNVFDANDARLQKVAAQESKTPFVRDKLKRKMKKLASLSSSIHRESSDSDFERSRPGSVVFHQSDVLYDDADDDEDDDESANFDYYEDSDDYDGFYASSYDNRSSSAQSSSSFNQSSMNESSTVSNNSNKGKRSFVKPRQPSEFDISPLQRGDSWIAENEDAISTGENDAESDTNKTPEHLNEQESSSDSDYLSEDDSVAETAPRKTRLSTTENDNVTKTDTSRVKPASFNKWETAILVSPTSYKNSAFAHRGNSFSESRRPPESEFKLAKNASFSFSNQIPPEITHSLNNLSLKAKFGGERMLRKNSEGQRFRANHSNLTRQLTNKNKSISNANSMHSKADIEFNINELAYALETRTFDAKPWKIEYLIYQACASAQEEGDLLMLTMMTQMFYGFFQKRLKQPAEYDFASYSITTYQAKCWLSAFIDYLRARDLYVVTGLIMKYSKISEIKEAGLVNTEIKKFCPHCKKLIIHSLQGVNSNKYNNWYCSNCNKFLGTCCLCNIPIKGLATGLLHCGHQGHTSCMKEWFVEEGETECPDCGEVPRELDDLVFGLTGY